jgi:hypothetical protein
LCHFDDAEAVFSNGIEQEHDVRAYRLPRRDFQSLHDLTGFLAQSPSITFFQTTQYAIEPENQDVQTKRLCL